MSDLRLSERLKLMADCHAKAKDPDAGMFHDAAQALVSLESTNAALAKRVAELESILDSWIAARKRLAERMRDLAEALRKLSPGPHTGPMDAEDYARIVESMLGLARCGEGCDGNCELTAPGPTKAEFTLERSGSEKLVVK